MSRVLLFVSCALIVASPSRAAATATTPDESLRLFVPALDRLGPLHAFFEEAGQSAASLRPGPFAELLHPLVLLPLKEPGRIESELGIASKGALSASLRGQAQLSCFEVSNAEKLQAAAKSQLERLGTLRPVKSTAGVKGWTAELPEGQATRIAGALVIRGKRACVARGQDAERHALEAVKSSLQPPKRSGKPPPAELLAVTPDGLLAFSANGDTLKVQAEGTRRLGTLPSFAGPGPSPYTLPASPGLLSARARLDAKGMPFLLEQARSQLGALCRGCQVDALLDAARPHFTGDLFLHVAGGRPRGGLRTVVDQYFSAKHALLLGVKDPKRVAALLTQAASRWPGAVQTEEGLRLALPGGNLMLGLRDRQLYVANDARALEAALGAVSASAPPLAHGAEWRIDAPAVGRTLGSISVLDVLAHPKLAGLLAVALELGPVLGRTTRLEGTANRGSGANSSPVLTAEWTLPAASTR